LIFKLLLDPADSLKLVVERITLAHHTLRSCLIVPEIGVFRLLV
jgi:hypothetical protein